MSMRVMQVKYNQKVKMNKLNSRQVFALNYTNSGSSGGKCCDVNYIQTPSHQQSYSNYNRRAMNGLGGQGGLASRVVNHTTDSNLQQKFGTVVVMNTVKRSPNFTPHEHIANKRSVALREDYSSITYADGTKKCKEPPEPICYNSCNKQRKSVITKDLGYLSSSQQINKKLSLRAGETSTCFKLFEAPIYGGNKC